MKKETESSNVKLSARSLVLNSLVPEGNLIKQKGKLYSDAVMLLFKKMGITETDIREINLQSVKQNKKIANEFEEQIKAEPLPLTELTEELMLRTNIPRLNELSVRDMPFPTGSWRFNLLEPHRNFSLDVEGLGEGMLEGTVTDEKISDPFIFRFVAMEKGDYRISAPVITIGPYYVIADDGPCNDRFAHLMIDFSIVVNKMVDNKAVSTYGFNGYSLVSKYETNAAIRNSLLVGIVAQPKTVDNNGAFLFFEKNDEISVVIRHRIYAKACGKGSIAKADFEKGTGTIYCPYLDVGWIGRP